MKNRIWDILEVISILLILWFAFSWVDVILHNHPGDCVYSAFNAFTILFNV